MRGSDSGRRSRVCCNRFTASSSSPRAVDDGRDAKPHRSALGVAFAKEVLPELLDAITGGPVAGSAFEHHIVRYMTEHKGLTPAMLEASLRRTKPDHWEGLMGTIAQSWIEEGRAEGLKRGRAEGIERGRSEALAELLLRQLSLRFGDVPDAVRERVRGASSAELVAWADAVLVATSLDDVLAARPRH